MSERVLHGLLASSAAAHPDRLAVDDAERTLTYAELEERSSRVAALLHDVGVAPGDRVGLYFDKRVDALVALYAALKAGAAYVPLDPQAPPARLAFIARDCEARVVLTGAEKAIAWDAFETGASVETLVVFGEAETAEERGAGGAARIVRAGLADELAVFSPRRRHSADDLAYILYTSGSTGQPKGVMLSHRNALAFVDWARDVFDVAPDDRLSNHAPLHFDLSVFDLFVAAGAGAAVVLVPPEVSLFPREVARFIDEHDISVWYSVPTVLTTLAVRGGLKRGSLSSLRAVLFAGEVFPTKYLRTLMETLPHARFYNLFGPTETNVCTFYEVREPPASDSAPIPIGKAIANVEAFAVTEDGDAAAAGEIGELHVRGPTVMRGYWGDAERTRRALVPDPRGRGGLVYRTGDLVEQTQDGDYLFIGRRDSQIKSRGYRIELGEIEAALHAHPAVVECAVVAIPDGVVTNRIRAAVVAREPVPDTSLVEFCAERIPRYMIPEAFARRSELPKTSTGKTDRQALQALLA